MGIQAFCSHSISSGWFDTLTSILPNLSSKEDELIELVGPCQSYGLYEKSYEIALAASAIEDLNARVTKIQEELQREQALALVAGKCLRVFAERIGGTLSKMTCRMIQIIDIQRLRAATLYFAYLECFGSSHYEKPQFCQNKKVCLEGLEAVAETIAFDLKPAETLLAASIGLSREDLFNV